MRWLICGLGVLGFLVGVLQLAALAGWLWPPLGSTVGILLTAGPIALIVGIQARAWSGGHSSRRVTLLAMATIAANAWWLVMGLLALGRVRATAGDFGLIWSWAITVSWTVGAVYFLAVARRRMAPRWAAVALAIGYLIGILGNDRLGLTHGPLGDLVRPAAFTGLILIGLAWVALGLDLVVERRLPAPGARARRWVKRAARAGLIVAVLAGVAFGAMRLATLNGPSAAARNELKAAIEDVAGATGHRYRAADDLGHEMGGAKIMVSPDPTLFVAVYASFRESDLTWVTYLATSHDLLTWTMRAILGEGASQPTVRAASDSGYVVAWEQEPPNHLKFAYYPTWDDLLAGTASKTFEPPMTLSTCAEGTPNLYAASSTALDVGFHFYDSCEVDRQARGTTDWTSWNASPQPVLEAMVRAHDVRGGVGDRDGFVFDGHQFTMLEGQAVLGDWTTFRVYLADIEAGFAEKLNMKTDAGSTAFTNPTVSEIEIGGRRPSS